MATNADWIIPASEDERRYFINETDNRYCKGNSPEPVIRAYFDRLYKELEEGKGKEAMLYDLLKVKLGKWHPRDNIPDTEEMRRQIDLSYPRLKGAIKDILMEGVFPGELNGKGEYQIASKNFLDTLNDMDANFKFTGKSVTNLLKQVGVNTRRDTTTRYLIFPELGIIRSLWSRQVGRQNWDTADVKWEIGKKEF